MAFMGAGGSVAGATFGEFKAGAFEALDLNDLRIVERDLDGAEAEVAGLDCNAGPPWGHGSGWGGRRPIGRWSFGDGVGVHLKTLVDK
jgi:hypothetical protein